MNEKKKYTVVFCTGRIDYSDAKVREDNPPNCHLVEKTGTDAEDVLKEAIEERCLQIHKRKIDKNLLEDWLHELEKTDNGWYLQDDSSDIFIVEKK